MEKEGTPKFLRHHQESVSGVAFHPKDRYLFCSGGLDGKVNLYCAYRLELLMCYQLTVMGLVRKVNAVRFTNDGRRILASTTAKRLTVIDVECGEQIMSYDNCAFNGSDRAALASDPICPNLAVCTCASGRGLTLLDLRMPLPLDYVHDLHTGVIRDITFLHHSWPFLQNLQSCILSLSCDGVCKVTSLDGRYLHSFEVEHAANSVAPTPEVFRAKPADGFTSKLMVGGGIVSAYVPDNGIEEYWKESGNAHIQKMRYTFNGGLLYTGGDDGAVKRYRRYPDHHEYLGEVYKHKSDIQDLDISSYDEYLVTASKDHSVGVLKLGAPSHGWTKYCELT